MIIAEQKPLVDIKAMLDGYQDVLVVGCGTCVTVCLAGGEKEVGILASALRMTTKLDGNGKDFDEVTVQRQCEWEYLDTVEKQVAAADVVVSNACGALASDRLGHQ